MRHTQPQIFREDVERRLVELISELVEMLKREHLQLSPELSHECVSFDVLLDQIAKFIQGLFEAGLEAHFQIVDLLLDELG